MATIRALLPAAGKGLRFGGAQPKQCLDLAGRPLMWHAIMAFLGRDEFAGVHVVLSAGAPQECEHWDGFFADGRLHFHRVGGETRAQSVRNGALAMDADDDDWIAVHDAARPCVSADLVGRMVDGIDGEEHGRVPGLPLGDALKRVENGRCVGTEPRDGRSLAQTPQLFRRGHLLAALASCAEYEPPDEAAAFERLGRHPTVVPGDPGNIKVTTAQDLPLAAAILAGRSRE